MQRIVQFLVTVEIADERSALEMSELTREIKECLGDALGHRHDKVDPSTASVLSVTELGG